MATPAVIWAKDGNKWKGIYCHHDGYLNGVGRILQKYYTTDNKVKSLISLGDISSIGPNLGTKHNFLEYDFDVVTAYHRDRGDKWEDVAPIITKHVSSAIIDSEDIRYIYFWDGKKWNCYDSEEEKWILGNNPEDKEESLESNTRWYNMKRKDMKEEWTLKDKANKWVKEFGWPDVDTALEWLDAGWTNSSEGLEWFEAGFTNPNKALQYRMFFGNYPEEAFKWYQKKVGPSMALELKKKGKTPETYRVESNVKGGSKMKKRMLEKVDRVRFANGEIGKLDGRVIEMEGDDYSIELVINNNFTDIKQVILNYDTRKTFQSYLKQDNKWTKEIQEDFDNDYDDGSFIDFIKKWLTDRGCKIINYGNTYNFEYNGSIYEFVQFDSSEKGEGVVVMWHLGQDVRAGYSAPEVWLGDFDEVLSTEMGDEYAAQEEVAYELGYNGDWDALVEDVVGQLNGGEATENRNREIVKRLKLSEEVEIPEVENVSPLGGGLFVVTFAPTDLDKIFFGDSGGAVFHVRAKNKEEAIKKAIAMYKRKMMDRRSRKSNVFESNEKRVASEKYSETEVRRHRMKKIKEHTNIAKNRIITKRNGIKENIDNTRINKMLRNLGVKF